MAIWQYDKRVSGIFSMRMRGNGYLGASGKKIWPRHSLRRPRFPIRRVYFHYPMTFTAYIQCFVHNFTWPCDFDLRPFDPGGVWWIKSLTHPTHIAIFSILRLSIPELCVTQSDHITSPGMVSAHAPCHVTYYRGAKWSTFLKSLTLI